MAHPDIITRYDYLMREYASDFSKPAATFGQLSQAFSDAGLAAAVEYRHSDQFAVKYAAAGFLGVGDLQEGLAAHNDSLVTQLPSYVELLEAQPLCANLKPTDAFSLLQENGMDVHAAAATGPDPLKTARRATDFHASHPEIGQAIAAWRQVEASGGYPHFHKIDNSLYLGDEFAVGILGLMDEGADPETAQATQLELLQAEGITHVVCCVEREPAFPEQLEYLMVPLGDNPAAEGKLEDIFEKAFQFMNEAVNGGGRVLVHCNCGMSRSATVVIGYLMTSKGMSYEDAYVQTKTARAVIAPNSGFENALIKLEMS